MRSSRTAASTLAPYKRVRRLEFAELPKTISGKIRRVELRAAEHAATCRCATRRSGGRTTCARDEPGAEAQGTWTQWPQSRDSKPASPAWMSTVTGRDGWAFTMMSAPSPPKPWSRAQ